MRADVPIPSALLPDCYNTVLCSGAGEERVDREREREKKKKMPRQ
jgi:hypothetical protein